MRLHHQLLAVSVLLLSLPWVAYQTVLEMESALRAGQAQALTATAEGVAAVLASDSAMLYPWAARANERQIPDQQLAFLPAQEAIVVDGYGNDWAWMPARVLEANNGFAVHYRSTACGKRFCLLLQVHDGDVRYDNPSRSAEANGDRVVLRTGDGSQYVLATSAPGVINAMLVRGTKSIHEPDIIAHWQDTATGYQVEVSLPAGKLFGRLGFYVVDESGNTRQLLGTMSDTDNAIAPWLISEPPRLRQQLAVFQRAGLRLAVIDNFYWQLAEVGAINTAQVSDSHWLLRAVYRAVLRNDAATLPGESIAGQLTRLEVTSALTGQSAGQWYRSDDPQARKLLSAAVPIVVNGEVQGAVLAEQSNEPYLSLTDHAFSRLLTASVLAIALTGFGLLGYASWLSWRIRRLSRAAHGVLGSKGEWRGEFPNSRAKDEIGDLARSYGSLFARLKEYTEYLRTLSRKLSHELRTPIAVVQSSLDNLANHSLDEQSRIYLQRAQEGTQRLSYTLTAMSEATRVEEAIRSAELEPTSLPALLHDMGEAYAGVHGAGRIRVQVAGGDKRVPVVPELIVQMLDKLVDNAVSFCPPDGEIILRYEDTDKGAVIEVINDGPLLPEHMQQQLFDNMVSLRETSDAVHLGLGLHIVRLIVEYHRGQVSAHNREDGKGVFFRVVFK